MAKRDDKSAQILPLDAPEMPLGLGSNYNYGPMIQKTLINMERVRVRMLAERSPIFAEALRYWRSGLRPIPMKPHDKRPLIKWAEFQDRAPTLAEICQWWTQHAEARVGIITGQGTKLVVVDVDPRNGGTLDDLDVPPAPQVLTPSGGFHLWFAHPEHPVASRSIRRGVDIKGEGGIAIAPPSPNYSWATPMQKLSPAPAWIFTQQAGPTAPLSEQRDQFIELFNESTLEGGRNTMATRLAGHLLRRGVAADAAVALLQPWAERCDPPFPQAELEEVIKNITLRDGKHKKRKRLTLHAPEDLPIVSVQFLIDALVPAGTLTLLYGKDKLGKTLLAMEMVKAVQTGSALFGIFPAQQGSVIALFLDDPPGLVRERLVDKMGLASTGVRVATHLDADDDPRNILADLADEAAIARPALIVVDALYVLLDSGEQLMSADMKAIVRPLDRIAEETGAAVVLIHHPTKKNPGDPAGSFVIRASAKSILGLKPSGEQGHRILHVESKFAAEAKYALQLSEPGPHCWTFLGDAQEVIDFQTEHEVMALVKEESGLLTTKEIAKRLGRREGEVLSVLRYHAEKGVLRREKDPGSTGRGQPRRPWHWIAVEDREHQETSQPEPPTPPNGLREEDPSWEGWDPEEGE